MVGAFAADEYESTTLFQHDDANFPLFLIRKS